MSNGHATYTKVIVKNSLSCFKSRNSLKCIILKTDI